MMGLKRPYTDDGPFWFPNSVWEPEWTITEKRIAMTLWLFRFAHVVGGGLWLGGYAVLALVIIPLMEKERTKTLLPLSITVVRLLTYSGTATIFFGLMLITRTRGFGALAN